MEQNMQQNMQHISNDMQQKSYHFLQFQRKYHTDKADDQLLMEHTTQPFWQSMRLSKRRLASKGLTMDVEVSHDSQSKTVQDETIHIRKDGHHLAGNKAMNVITHRQFYKNGKKISAFKDREICNLALLKTEVNGDQAACPNCGFINTITSFIDGCDACDSKFTVQDFETKVSAFSLEENTRAKIKDTVISNAKSLGKLMGGFILLAIIALILAAIRFFVGFTDINMVDVIIGLLISILSVPVIFKVLIVLGIVYTAGASYLMSIYKKPVLQESIVKQVLPDFSARDFYQNLEYKLRNIHLTDKVEEVSVFSRCALNDVIRDYHNVVECDMTRLKFIDFIADQDGYRVNIETEIRLTEYKEKRIITNYEKLNLTLFGRPDVIDKSVITLRQYQCPGCGSSINVLEGGKCNYCGNTFDYSEFGWVIESYQSIRKPISLYQFIKYTMIAIFVAVLGFNILFPIGIGNENIFEFHSIFTEQAAELEKFYNDMKRPDELYEDVTLRSHNDYMIERIYKYETNDADTIMKQYRSYLEEQGFVFYKETENSFIVYQSFILSGSKDTEPAYYRITVMKENSNITLDEDMVSDLDEILDLDFEGVNR